MNRRAFLKLVGVSVVAMMLPMSETSIKEVSKIIVPECPGCAAGLPIKKIGWIMYEPSYIIINDNAITKIVLTGA